MIRAGFGHCDEINDVRIYYIVFVSVPASAVPDNWCQKWDVQRREDESKKACHGSSGVYTMKEICQVLGGRHLTRPTSTYTAAIATREATINN